MATIGGHGKGTAGIFAGGDSHDSGTGLEWSGLPINDTAGTN